MSEFKIISPHQENIILSNELPADVNKYKMRGGRSMMASGHFGRMLFHHVKGDGFDIWYSNYLMGKTSIFIGSASDAILELHIPFVNDFKTWWDGLQEDHMRHRQFEISYVPFVHTRVEFTGGQEYHTFDIHFNREILQPYALHCRRLSELLEQVEKGKPANMLDTVQFLSLDMVRIIWRMLDYDFHEDLALSYYNALVHELLVLLTIQVAGITDKPKFAAIDLHRAQQAHQLILSDFETYDTVNELAAKTGTTGLKLQLAFRHCYGTTVSKFSREARLEKAYLLLQENKYPIRHICLLVGYPDPANFSVAFKNHYGYWPGAVQKSKRH